MKTQDLLNQLGETLYDAAAECVLDSRPITISRIDTIAGPRAGAVEMWAGLDAARLLRALAADDCALVRQFIPWEFPMRPAAYLSGRTVRVEAGWPDDLAQKAIKVSSLSQRTSVVDRSDRWIAGINELGSVVTLGFSDAVPHLMVSGTTGSGKSVALRSMLVQLARHGARLVLIDGKFGDGLRIKDGGQTLDHLSGAVGPIATDLDSARAALAYAVKEMTDRYEHPGAAYARLVVVIDEVQELTADTAIVDMIRRIAAQGRAAKVSIVLATQHPVNDAFGDSAIKRNVTGRIALLVADDVASRVAVGQSTPRADWLYGKGDAFVVLPGAVHRTQIAYIDSAEIKRELTAQPLMAEWPVMSAEDLNNTVQSSAAYTAPEMAVSVISAYHGYGRDKLQRALVEADLGKPGTPRAIRLMGLGRDLLGYLRDEGYDLVNTRESD